MEYAKRRHPLQLDYVNSSLNNSLRCEVNNMSFFRCGARPKAVSHRRGRKTPSLIIARSTSRILSKVVFVNGPIFTSDAGSKFLPESCCLTREINSKGKSNDTKDVILMTLNPACLALSLSCRVVYLRMW